MPIQCQNIKDRLEAKVERIPESGCWIWMGCCDHCGYGRITVGSRSDGTRKLEGVHRVSYEAYIGPIYNGDNILHRCDTPSCFNPHHLFSGTRKDNAIDCQKKNRYNHPIGENHGNAKLTEGEVLQIFRSPLAKRGIARIYGISDTLVRRIKRGEMWKHITHKGE